ncbi:hypothetical protein LP032_045 [Listeria phage LP-032]|uniref:Uncharacterized protein n=5 Tax=Homburgvirus TaxID=1921125 RepID=A0A059TAN9_9CAUD|nr:hypothetical protein LP026_003 [Listeria phage LP-026]AHL18894.1 hypothetical protein LP032_045 [Listeria phage LP-032]QDK04533.1 hypothetical protein FK481_0019 [Listeria phage LP-010]QDK04641.1 hypothetical protein FK482_0019 [Listeria phage LP-013]QDK04752.1 hypothetical protein FK484_0019 [Listeria phage LP-031]AHN84697.1 hypothetical protein LP026_003 [Listeria phage LP-026]
MPNKDEMVYKEDGTIDVSREFLNNMLVLSTLVKLSTLLDGTMKMVDDAIKEETLSETVYDYTTNTIESSLKAIKALLLMTEGLDNMDIPVGGESSDIDVLSIVLALDAVIEEADRVIEGNKLV